MFSIKIVAIAFYVSVKKLSRFGRNKNNVSNESWELTYNERDRWNQA